MLKTVSNFVLGRTSPYDVREIVRLSRRASCGLVGIPF